MAIIQGLCTSFKSETLQAVHNFNVDTFNIALYSSVATLDSTTTAYSVSSEVTGAGYTAGGIALTGVSVQVLGTIAYITFNNAIWAAALIAVRGALIYNVSKANKAVAVLDFGADKQSSNNSFIVQMPSNSAITALIRFA